MQRDIETNCANRQLAMGKEGQRRASSVWIEIEADRRENKEDVENYGRSTKN